VAFLLLDHGGRVLGTALGRGPVTPFTPSRFLFDLQHLLAVFASGGLVWLGRQIPTAAGRSAACVGMAVLLCTSFGLVMTGRHFGFWKRLALAPRDAVPPWHSIPDDEVLPLGDWIQRNTPLDALILGSGSPWWTYVSRRESCSLFIPISELPLGDRIERKERMIRDYSPLSWSRWTEELGKPIYVVLTGEARFENRTPLHSQSGWHIYGPMATLPRG
jgi:hypothetical protein